MSKGRQETPKADKTQMCLWGSWKQRVAVELQIPGCAGKPVGVALVALEVRDCDCSKTIILELGRLSVVLKKTSDCFHWVREDRLLMLLCCCEASWS